MPDGGGSRAPSVAPTEQTEDDFDLNAEELPTEEDEQTPAVSNQQDQDEDSADVETEDEELADDVGPAFQSLGF